jgi:tRNA G46 methylase TrmB
MNAPEMTEYTEAFYDDQERQSLASARVVLDQLFAHYHPTSVVDIGCGLGTWLAACTERGATDILGIDGRPRQPETAAHTERPFPCQ